MDQTLVASKRLRYNTRALNAGDEFQARERDARLLVALGHAAHKPAAKPAAQAKPKPQPAPPAPPPVERVKRAYHRRDLNASTSIEEVPHVQPRQAETESAPWDVPAPAPAPADATDDAPSTSSTPSDTDSPASADE
jgi:hypothetical protein